MIRSEKADRPDQIKSRLGTNEVIKYFLKKDELKYGNNNYRRNSLNNINKIHNNQNQNLDYNQEHTNEKRKEDFMKQKKFYINCEENIT